MDRQQLRADLLEELSSHTPAGMMRHLRRWPSGPLSLVHLQVLAALGDDGPLPMRVLAESLDVSQASTTGIVDRMEQRGLVERRRDDTDRRIVRVALTAAGRELIAGLAAERKERLAFLLDQLTDEELSGFLAGTRALGRARERLHAHLLAEADGANGTLGLFGAQGVNGARSVNGVSGPDSRAASGHPVSVRHPEPSPVPTTSSPREASR